MKTHILILCLLLSIVAFFGCAEIPDDLRDEAEGKTFTYCVLEQQLMCLTGTFTHKDCSGKPKNNCPYGSPKGCNGSVFNSSVSFCYDGNVYQKCSGMEYNPTTHICEVYVANPAKCNGTQYNPMQEGCCGSAIYQLSNDKRCSASNAVETKCETGNNYHNPQTQFCSGNGVYDKCGGNTYNPLEHGCCASTNYSLSSQRCGTNSIIETKCGTGSSYYNPETQFCNGNSVYSKCGGMQYDPSEQSCCASVLFSLSNQRCQSNVIETKCGTGWYNAANASLRCENNAIETKCGTDWYDATNANLRCQNNVIESRCGTNGWYNPVNQRCGTDNVVETKCSGQGFNEIEWYDSTDKNLRCNNSAGLQVKCGTNWVQVLALYYDYARCQDGVLEHICGGGGGFYNPVNQRCGDGIVETKCGTNGWYNPISQRCGTDNVVEAKCGSDWYNSATHYCKNGTTSTQYGYETYEGQTYKTVVIGTQTWMAENLNYDTDGSKCYDNQESICDKYGRLYDWATVMGFEATCNSSSCADQVETPHQGICPDGWHIPSNADWDALMTAIGGSSTAGTHLKATSDWNIRYNCLDTYGFSALPGGYYSDGNFSGVGNYGKWWSSSAGSNGTAYYRYMDYNNEGVGSYDSFKSGLGSVRCVQD